MNLFQVIHALECGTGEVKEVLLEEINLMYECKTCFAVFRSVANLIAHKRTFCKGRYKDVHHIYRDKYHDGMPPPPPDLQVRQTQYTCTLYTKPVFPDSGD